MKIKGTSSESRLQAPTPVLRMFPAAPTHTFTPLPQMTRGSLMTLLYMPQHLQLQIRKEQDLLVLQCSEHPLQGAVPHGHYAQCLPCTTPRSVWCTLVRTTSGCPEPEAVSSSSLKIIQNTALITSCWLQTNAIHPQQ